MSLINKRAQTKKKKKTKEEENIEKEEKNVYRKNI